MTPEESPARTGTTYHALWAGEELLSLVRLGDADSGGGETYVPGEGWVRSTAAYDVLRNGQDYDLLTAAEAEELALRMEAGEV